MRTFFVLTMIFVVAVALNTWLIMFLFDWPFTVWTVVRVALASAAGWMASYAIEKIMDRFFW